MLKFHYNFCTIHTSFEYLHFTGHCNYMFNVWWELYTFCYQLYKNFENELKVGKMSEDVYNLSLIHI